ncbi:DUF2771 domain-containing protein [Corynebacterium sp. 320]|nr:DUF2771 domain-containing protein [Corynebacterium sp. 320]KAB1551507.1 DUF2771 domain-containing protein [Corynebacterium sp. 321]KAB1551665.1 DUF2771 domain-containing protein [Corynebacterium sp. 319]KAB3525703.1 DUF2771 domain-containing protein [Corynebacterium sp. 250]KAB3538655.1 DUF2771 domain-containing protein [Corynebacterium sp. 366]QNP92614.1 DUF2771 domain-containing protein [Corynebacterium zhongnanshanii]
MVRVTELTKKQRRKKQQRRQLLIGLAIVCAVIVVVGAVLGYNAWKDRQVDVLPQDQRITAVVGDREIELAPYSTCEVDDAQCTPSQPTTLELHGAKEFTLKIPEDVYDHDWSLLKVFDDPGANEDNYFKSDEKHEVTLSVEADKKASDGSTPQLKVVEVQSLLIGVDADKQQTPIMTIWSLEIVA